MWQTQPRRQISTLNLVLNEFTMVVKSVRYVAGRGDKDLPVLTMKVID